LLFFFLFKSDNHKFKMKKDNFVISLKLKKNTKNKQHI
jgi:hypothetical protein